LTAGDTSISVESAAEMLRRLFTVAEIPAVVESVVEA